LTPGGQTVDGDGGGVTETPTPANTPDLAAMMDAEFEAV
jgi:hypothetical protein